MPALDICPGVGAELHALATRLFPIARNSTGPGFRETLDILEERSGPMARYRWRTGEPVFDWNVPDEWAIRRAWIKGPSGETIVDFAESNLHILGYSEPVHRRLSLKELQDHLHSLPEQPTAIPYVTSYYERRWGFCLPQQQRDGLRDGEYEVYIDADLGPGELTVGEVVVSGATEREILFSTSTAATRHWLTTSCLARLSPACSRANCEAGGCATPTGSCSCPRPSVRSRI